MNECECEYEWKPNYPNDVIKVPLECATQMNVYIYGEVKRKTSPNKKKIQ